MSALSGTTRSAGLQTAFLPRVNLLPPEIAERVVFRKVQLGLGAAVLAAVAVVILLDLSASHGVNSAQTQLDTATTQHATLQRQTGKYRDVTAVYAAAAASEAQLRTAMADEVRYSQLLNDLSLTVPKNVWFKNVTFLQTPPVAADATAVPAAPAAGGNPIGTVTISGVGYSHDDVATWLDTVAGLKTYQDPYFSSSAAALLGTRKTVTFSSTATIDSTALSGRYSKVGG